MRQDDDGTLVVGRATVPPCPTLTFVAGLSLVARQVADAHEVIPGLHAAAVMLAEVGGAPEGTGGESRPCLHLPPLPEPYLSVMPQTLKKTSAYFPRRCCTSISRSTGCMSTLSICRQPWNAVWLERQPVSDAGLGQPAGCRALAGPGHCTPPWCAHHAPTSKKVLAAGAELEGMSHPKLSTVVIINGNHG